MKLIDKLKDEFPGLNENMLLQFIEEARKEVMKEDEQGRKSRQKNYTGKKSSGKIL